MRVKDICDVDTVNYKKLSMFISTYTCDFKCDRECGESVCQNSPLAAEPTVEVNDEEIVKRFFENPLTEAIVIGGLEPYDDYDEIFIFLCEVEKYLEENQINEGPDIVIYTGYEIGEPKFNRITFSLYNFDLPIILKVGRFIPNQTPHYDAVLGVDLASDNQYGITLEDALNEIESRPRIKRGCATLSESES